MIPVFPGFYYTQFCRWALRKLQVITHEALVSLIFLYNLLLENKFRAI